MKIITAVSLLGWPRLFEMQQNDRVGCSQCQCDDQQAAEWLPCQFLQLRDISGNAVDYFLGSSLYSIQHNKKVSVRGSHRDAKWKNERSLLIGANRISGQ